MSEPSYNIWAPSSLWSPSASSTDGSFSDSQSSGWSNSPLDGYAGSDNTFRACADREEQKFNIFSTVTDKKYQYTYHLANPPSPPQPWLDPPINDPFNPFHQNTSRHSTSPNLLSMSSNESILLQRLNDVSLGSRRNNRTSFSDPDLLLPYSMTEQYNAASNNNILHDKRPPPGPSATNKKVELYKTELCRNWEEKGFCEYNTRCQYAHGEEELRPIERDPRWKTKPCKTFMLTGKCVYAKRCCYRHDQGQNTLNASSAALTRKPLLERVGIVPEVSEPIRQDKPRTRAKPTIHLSSLAEPSSGAYKK